MTSGKVPGSHLALRAQSWPSSSPEFNFFLQIPQEETWPATALGKGLPLHCPAGQEVWQKGMWAVGERLGDGQHPAEVPRVKSAPPVLGKSWQTL